MRSLRSAAIVLPFVLCAAAFGQSNWDKSYNVSGKAAISVEVDDASVRVNACGNCRTVRIHVDANGNDLSKFRVTEMQGGDGIHFTLRHPEMSGFFSSFHGRSPDVIIDTPADTQLNVRSGDGSLQITGIRSGADVHTGNGSIQMSDVAGALRATTGDGGVQIHQGDGTLFATSGNGSLTIEGRFTQFETRSGDGSVRLSLLSGSRLTASSRVATGNGSITLELPRDLQAEIQASTGSGSISNSLPLNVTTSGARNNLHGSMNGGGPSVRLQTGDGSIRLSPR
jgi:Putative adhesin